MKKAKQLKEADLRILVDCILAVQNGNYTAKRKKTKKELLAILGLTP
jgi:hypothetical protein